MGNAKYYLIINAHMEGLVKVSAVSEDNDLRRLRLLYDRVEAHVRASQALGINSESYVLPQTES